MENKARPILRAQWCSETAMLELPWDYKHQHHRLKPKFRNSEKVESNAMSCCTCAMPLDLFKVWLGMSLAHIEISRGLTAPRTALTTERQVIPRYSPSSGGGWMRQGVRWRPHMEPKSSPSTRRPPHRGCISFLPVSWKKIRRLSGLSVIIGSH